MPKPPSATPNLDRLQRIRKTFTIRLTLSHVAIFGGLALVYTSDLLAKEPITFICGAALATAGTFAVGLSMVLETLATRKIPLTSHERTIVARQGSQLKDYKDLPRTVRWWRRTFSIMRWTGLAIVLTLVFAVVFNGAHAGVLFIALFMLIPPFLAQRYSEDLMALWSPGVAAEKTLDPVDYIKGTTTGREVFGYWLAFIGIMVINSRDLDNAIFEPTIVTPILVLLSIGSTAKMLSTGHKEFAEARETVVKKARTP